MIERKISIKELEAQMSQTEDVSIFEAERVANVRSGAEFSAEREEEGIDSLY